MNVEHKKLNMGCGFIKLNDHWNVDIEPKCNPDQVLDLEKTPWPYEDNFFEKITADSILEHLGQDPKVFTKVIQEMYRVSKNQAEWFIKVPHHRCDLFWDDYTHVRVITEKTLRMFDQRKNWHDVENKVSDSPYGLYHNVDLELLDINYDLIYLWRNQLEEGMIGHKQLNIALNTKSNVAETVTMFVKVHKPGRYIHLISSN
jgi:predicted SAM-dependent methyltransferase